MCRIYHTIGCLNTIQSRLVENNIDDFNSLNDLNDFTNTYNVSRQHIILKHTSLLEEEKIALDKEISEFNLTISDRVKELKEELRAKLDFYNREIDTLSLTTPNLTKAIESYWTNLILFFKFWFVQILTYFRIHLFRYNAKKILISKSKRLHYLSINFQDALAESSSYSCQMLDKKKEIIEQLKNTIYGAYGENQVEKELGKLSDDYTLINDFCFTFDSPLYYNGDYIKSIQIDHLLICTSGIFLIETKNWSNRSINSLDLRSPVQQVLRTNYALYKLLSQNNKSGWNFTRNHWGERKIPLKNVITFTGTVPKEQFQFIKILGINELLNYIQYFSSNFTNSETEQISDFLLNLSKQKKIISKLTI